MTSKQIQQLKAKADNMHLLMLDSDVAYAALERWPRNWHYVPYKVNWHYVPMLPGRKVAIAGDFYHQDTFDAPTVAVRCVQP